MSDESITQRVVVSEAPSDWVWMVHLPGLPHRDGGNCCLHQRPTHDEDCAEECLTRGHWIAKGNGEDDQAKDAGECGARTGSANKTANKRKRDAEYQADEDGIGRKAAKKCAHTEPDARPQHDAQPAAQHFLAFGEESEECPDGKGNGCRRMTKSHGEGDETRCDDGPAQCWPNVDRGSLDVQTGADVIPDMAWNSGRHIRSLPGFPGER
jgi:hypothetical protein